MDGFVLFLALCSAANNNGGGATLLILCMAGITGLALRYATKQGLWFVRRVERTWAQVCSGLGGNFVGEKNDYLASVREGFASKGRYVETQKKVAYPELKNIRGNWKAWTAEVRFFDGQTIDDYNKNAPAFALAYNVPFCTFDLDEESGLIRVRAGRVPVPEPYEYPVEPVTVPAALPASDLRAVLRAVPMAKDINGNPWYLPIEGNHVLIVGRTGAGKNSWTWTLVFGLAQARRAGLVRLWGLDPKRVELAFGRDWWDEYADTAEDMVALLEKAVDGLLERNKQIQGKARRFTPSLETPLNVIVIDELAYLSAAVEKKMHERAQRAMRTILWLGRATGFSLVGASQSPLKEVLAERDYYPTKVAMAMEAPMVDLVLGEGAHENGAYCERIPLREAGAGCAFVKEEMSNKALLVRAAWCSDEAIRMMLANPQAFGVQVKDESKGRYEQGYGQQPLQQWQYRIE